MRRVALGAGLVAAGALGVGWVIARRLTAPPSTRRYDLTVREVERDGDGPLIVLDRTRRTAAEGAYNLWFENGGWAQLSEDVLDRGPTLIARRVTSTASGLTLRLAITSPGAASTTRPPHDAGLHAHDITIDTPAVLPPAWRIDGDGARSTWAIHLHGLGSVRAGTLRGVLAATERGYTSLVVSYRADGEGPGVGNGRSMLGFTEADDAAAAIEYAMRHGARQIVLFGWSMGAAIALQLAHHPSYRRSIAGLVLDSPVLDWTEVIKANCARSGFPRSRGQPRDSVADAPPAGPHGRPARAHPAPILRLDGSCRGTHRAHAHPSRHPRRLRTDTALTRTPRCSAWPCVTGGLRSKTHALMEL